MGRPSGYTPEIGERIASRIAVGETLRSITRDDDMPSWQTVYAWMGKDQELADRIACARARGFDAIAEEALQIAEDGSNDWMEREHGPQLNAEHVQRSKLRIETRLKLLAKWDPKRYGDRQVIAGDPDAPLTKPVSQEELADQLVAALAKAQAGRK